MYAIQIKINTKYINRFYQFTQDHYSFVTPEEDYKPIEKFCVKITGESMINAGITPGSIVEITKNISVFHNDIILAKVNGVHTIKRLFINHDNSYTLYPENIDYEPIDVHEDMAFEIEGVVTNVIRN
jgi:DNA polymerase V